MKSIIFGIALMIAASAASADTITVGNMWHCTAGHGDCKNKQTRGNAVIALVQNHTGCYSGFEAGCAQIVGNIYVVNLKEHGSSYAHYCWDYHYVYNVGATASTNPWTGATGVEFVTNYNIQKHCKESSGNPSLGSPSTDCGSQNLD